MPRLDNASLAVNDLIIMKKLLLSPLFLFKVLIFSIFCTISISTFAKTKTPKAPPKKDPAADTTVTNQAPTEETKAVTASTNTAPVVGNLLKSTDFANLKAWRLRANVGGEMTTQVSPDGPGGKPALQIIITKPGENASGVTFSQTGLKLMKDVKYTLSFSAKSSELKKMDVAIKAVKFRKSFDLTPEWQDFKVDIIPKEGSDVALLYVSGFSTAPGTLWFSNPVLESQAESTGSPTPSSSEAPATSQAVSTIKKGEIVSVDLVGKTLVLSNAETKTNETYTLEDASKLSLNGVSITLADIKPAAKAVITTSGDTKIIENIEFTAP
jgi:hypothetical protein